MVSVVEVATVIFGAAIADRKAAPRVAVALHRSVAIFVAAVVIDHGRAKTGHVHDVRRAMIDDTRHGLIPSGTVVTNFLFSSTMTSKSFMFGATRRASSANAAVSLGRHIPPNPRYRSLQSR